METKLKQLNQVILNLVDLNITLRSSLLRGLDLFEVHPDVLGSVIEVEHELSNRLVSVISDARKKIGDELRDVQQSLFLQNQPHQNTETSDSVGLEDGGTETSGGREQTEAGGL